MDTSAKQPLFVTMGNALKSSVGSIFGGKPAVAQTPAPAPTYTTRGQTFGDPDVNQLKQIVYSEVSNRPKDKQELEARILFNTALNRMAESHRVGKSRTLTDVLTAPNQYQGYNSPLYKTYNAPSDALNLKRKEQLDGITDKLVSEVKGGTFADNTNGAFYYKHKGDKIYYDDKRPLFVQN